MGRRKVSVENTIADYVHLRAENYLKHGTLHPRNEKTNYDENVFTNFRNNILARSQQIDQLKENQILLKAQKQYNQSKRENYELLKKFLTSPDTSEEDKRQFFGMLLEIADTQTIDIDFLVKNVKFDDRSQNITLLNSVFSNAGKIRKVSKLNKNRAFSWLSTIENRLNNNIKKLFNSAQGQKNLSNKLKKDIQQDITIIETYIKALKESKPLFIENQEVKELSSRLQKEEFDKTKQLNSKLFYFFKGPKDIQLSPGLSDFLNEKIRVIQTKMSLSIGFNNIMAAFSEFMAGAINRIGKTIAIDTIDTVVHTAVVGSNIPKVTQKVKAEANKAIQKYKMEDDAFGIQIIEDHSKGKIDAFVYIKDGLELAASVKNYNLSNEYFHIKNKKDIPASVSLVKGTTLSSLLLTAESYQKNLGTHFLNVLTNKDDDVSQLLPIRKSAIDALNIFLIYIGLTGGHGDLSMREAPGADVLIVEDKTDGYAYFFSISNILGKAMQSLKQSDFSRYFYLTSNGKDIDSIWLKNKKVGNAPISANINTRLGNVLARARIQKLEAAISIPNYINKNKQKV